MQPSRLTFVPDVSVGEWIAPRLGPFGGWVGAVVPRGFPAYVRVLHPIDDGAGATATWSDVCAVTGREPHALMQWESISIPHVPDGTAALSTGRPWDGDEPRIGDLVPTALAALCRVLAGRTDPEHDVYFGLWEGWGWLGDGEAILIARSWFGGAPESTADLVTSTISPPAFDETVLAGPRLHHPSRDYLLFTGPLAAATELGHWALPDWFIPQSPSLIWPSGHSWCVATEIDFRCTLIGGSTDLIEAILAEPTLDAWPVDPADFLGDCGDSVNT